MISSLAIIPARSGSKRIPQKNIQPFLGEPIIKYSIVSALNSKLFDEVMVSTDSDRIADIAKSYGAIVPFLRSVDNSNDTATTADVIKEVLHHYITMDKFFDVVFCIYPTAPFVSPKRLQEAYEILLSKKDINSVIPVVSFSYPPQRGLIIENNRLRMQHPEYKSSRSQDLETIFHDSGQFYALKTDHFMKSYDIWSGKIYPLILSELEVQDIDNTTDWAIAEMKYKLLKGE